MYYLGKKPALMNVARRYAQRGKTDPSFSSIEKIATALSVELSELFHADEVFKEINSADKSLTEKIWHIELHLSLYRLLILIGINNCTGRMT